MATTTFQALLIEETAPGTFRRRIAERCLDELPDHPVLVKVLYSSLNYKDALSAVGNRGVTRRYPHTPGIDAAGIVAASADPRFAPGDEVIVSCYDLGMNTSGGLGQYIRVPGAWVMQRPEGLSLRESMVFGTAGFTAAHCVSRLEEYPLHPGDGKVLVTGATGGVGSWAVAMLARNGYQVTAVTGKPEQEALLRELGATAILSRDQAVDTSGRMLLKEKWAGVVDTVGGAILATAVKSARYGGVVTCCGNVASPDLHLNVYPFILRGVALIGIDSAECPMATRLAIWEKIARQWRLPALDRLCTEIPLTDLDPYIDRILQGKQTGRVLVRLW